MPADAKTWTWRAGSATTCSSRGSDVSAIGASVWPKNCVNTGPNRSIACFNRSGAMAAAPYSTLRKLPRSNASRRG